MEERGDEGGGGRGEVRGREEEKRGGEKREYKIKKENKTIKAFDGKTEIMNIVFHKPYSG